MISTVPKRLMLLGLSIAVAGGGCWNAQRTLPAIPEPIIETTATTTANATSTVQATSTKTTVPAKATVQPKGTSKPAAKTVYVQILSGRFSPQVIAAAPGDTVVWTNKDTVPHTSHSDNVLLWDTGSLAPGKSGSHKFPSVGSYPYSDANTGIKGTVVIN